LHGQGARSRLGGRTTRMFGGTPVRRNPLEFGP
jgi:hypothetical protein